MNTRRLSVDPSSYTPLMSLIGTIESNDNYNAYFGNPRNHEIKFTDMTIDEVMRWQADFIADGNASSAVGRYQIISTTLIGLVRELKIDTKEKFTQQMQDRMAIALFERRGSIAFINKEITAEEFTASLAKEWAALPKVIGNNPGSSYYAHDGLNKSRTSPDKIIATVNKLSAK
jgi:muramidase (phage lysozyme)